MSKFLQQHLIPGRYFNILIFMTSYTKATRVHNILTLIVPAQRYLAFYIPTTTDLYCKYVEWTLVKISGRERVNNPVLSTVLHNASAIKPSVTKTCVFVLTLPSMVSKEFRLLNFDHKLVVCSSSTSKICGMFFKLSSVSKYGF